MAKNIEEPHSHPQNSNFPSSCAGVYAWIVGNRLAFVAYSRSCNAEFATNMCSPHRRVLSYYVNNYLGRWPAATNPHSMTHRLIVKYRMQNLRHEDPPVFIASGLFYFSERPGTWGCRIGCGWFIFKSCVGSSFIFQSGGLGVICPTSLLRKLQR